MSACGEKTEKCGVFSVQNGVKGPEFNRIPGLCGAIKRAAGQIRTADLILTKDALYLLSYSSLLTDVTSKADYTHRPCSCQAQFFQTQKISPTYFSAAKTGATDREADGLLFWGPEPEQPAPGEFPLGQAVVRGAETLLFFGGEAGGDPYSTMISPV